MSRNSTLLSPVMPSLLTLMPLRFGVHGTAPEPLPTFLNTSIPAFIQQHHTQALDQLAPHLTPKQFQKLAPGLEVILSYRMRSCAGQAIAGHQIKLNARLLKNYPEEWLPTYIHELAHIVVYRLFQSRGHGQAWQQSMAWFGYPPQRTHRMDVSHLQYRQQRYAYQCQCRDHQLSAHRHRKIQRGSQYRCRHCQADLYPKPQ